MKIKDRLAMHVHTESGELFDAAAMIGAQQYSIAMEWAEIERKEGVFTYERDDACMKRVRENSTSTPYARLFMTPAWVEPQLTPQGDPNAPFVPFLSAKNSGLWKKALDKTLSRYHLELNLIGIDNEINDKYFWLGTPEEFANNVILPAAEVIHAHNMKVVAPGITIQKYESKEHYARAKDCMERVLAVAKNQIDYICFHSYGRTAERVIKQIISFCDDCGISEDKIMLTETGFTENYYWAGEEFWRSITDLFRSGQERQLNRYRIFTDWLEKDIWANRLLNVSIYRGFDTREDPKETHGLTKPEQTGYVLKQAGKHLKGKLGG